MSRAARRGEHRLEPVSSRTLPQGFPKIPAGHRAASCPCGGHFVARTQDELERQHAEHIMHLDAQGQGFSALYDEAYIHVPVLHSERVGQCPDGHRTVITATLKTTCDECGEKFARTEAEAPWRTTIIVHLWEWLGMDEDERRRWVTEEGRRQVDAKIAQEDAARSAPAETPEQASKRREASRLQLEAQWYAIAAEQAKEDAHGLEVDADALTEG